MASLGTTTSRTGTEPAAGARTRNRCVSPIFSGFTLVEVVLVTLVVALLAAAAVPRMSETAQRLRVEQTAAELAQLARAAHEQAVAGAQVVAWRWEGDARRAAVVVEGAAGLEGARLLESAPVPAAIEVTLALPRAADCACARFFPDSTSDGGTVTLEAPAGAYTVAIDATTSQVALRSGPAPR